jgi:hypothetical protein
VLIEWEARVRLRYCFWGFGWRQSDGHICARDKLPKNLKIVNFCTRIKIFAHLALLTIWGSQSQTAQYRQSNWWYPKQWLMKWFWKDDKDRKWTIVMRSKWWQTLGWNTYWNGGNQFLCRRSRLQDVIVMHTWRIRNGGVEWIWAIYLVDQMDLQERHAPCCLTSLFQIIRHRLFVHLRTKYLCWTMSVGVINGSCWVATPHSFTGAWHLEHIWLVLNSQMFKIVALWIFLRWSFAKYDDLVGDSLYPGDEGLNLPPLYAMIVLLGSSPSIDLQVWSMVFRRCIYAFHLICFVFLRVDVEDLMEIIWSKSPLYTA